MRSDFKTFIGILKFDTLNLKSIPYSSSAPGGIQPNPEFSTVAVTVNLCISKTLLSFADKDL
ncbi:MAG TPA: hypothetical protein PK981_07740 [Accumulibacter sp.]|nr:hypothetical protein [Accumulibacter sp.]HNG38922.1 hypothetical protein [Accumulibacter sp.]HNL14365.1 hypothetical protein [Accumulibacter sp.]HNL76606.1 hypothetical protein [Accumulibacter sp.]